MSVKILLVEDDPDIIEIIHEELTHTVKGCRVDGIQCARTALSILDNSDYDIVISDMGLKDKWVCGKDVLEKANTKGCFTVLFSGLGHYPGLHLDYNLKKPFHGNELNDMISVFKEGAWMGKVKESTGFVHKVTSKYIIRRRKACDPSTRIRSC